MTDHAKPSDAGPLFSWVAPIAPSPTPIEPTPDRYRREPDDPRSYSDEWREWVASHEHEAGMIEAIALEAVRRGEKRVSVNDIFEELRKSKTPMDQNHRAACGR